MKQVCQELMIFTYPHFSKKQNKVNFEMHRLIFMMRFSCHQMANKHLMEEKLKLLEFLINIMNHFRLTISLKNLILNILIMLHRINFSLFIKDQSFRSSTNLPHLEILLRIFNHFAEFFNVP